MKPDPIELTIDELAAGGDGVGRDPDGRVVFVPRTAPGDRVRVELTQSKKRFARGAVLEVLDASPARVEPACEHFVAGCGGCQWQHVSLEAQRAAKQAIVASALRRAIADGLQVEPIATPAPGLGWRRRARLHWVRRRRDSAALIGMFASRTHAVLDVPSCPQLEDGLNDALAMIRASLAPALTGKGEIDVVVGVGGAVHLVVRGPCDPAAVAGLVDSGKVRGAGLGKRRYGEPVEIDAGIVGGADHFAQASRAGNAALLDRVNTITSPRENLTVLELYAGGGNLTRVLAEGASELVAVDTQRAEPVAANVSTRQGDVLDAVRLFARKERRFDLVVLDPPRTGAKEIAGALGRLTDRVIYVSCDAATLARDLDQMREAGLRAVQAWPIDMMPQTSHVELVVDVRRAP